MNQKAEASFFTIRPELKFALPPNGIPALRHSLEHDGQLEPITVWHSDGENIIVDGHNRYEVLKDLEREIEYRTIDFEDENAARRHVFENQLQKRNLNEVGRAYAIGTIYRHEKNGHGGAREASGQDDHLKTEELIGSRFSVSGKTVRRYADLSKAIDLIQEHISLEARNDILNGKVKFTIKHVEDILAMVPEDLNEFDELDELLSSLKKPSTPPPSPVKKVQSQVQGMNPDEYSEFMSWLYSPWEGELDLSEFETFYSSPKANSVRTWRNTSKDDFATRCFRSIPSTPKPKVFLIIQKFEAWCLENNKEFQRI